MGRRAQRTRDENWNPVHAEMDGWTAIACKDDDTTLYEVGRGFEPVVQKFPILVASSKIKMVLSCSTQVSSLLDKTRAFGTPETHTRKDTRGDNDRSW